MELLVIKDGEHYFRFEGDSHFPCRLNEASVFSMEKVAEVKALKRKLEKDGLSAVGITKLTISEEPFLMES